MNVVFNTYTNAMYELMNAHAIEIVEYIQQENDVGEYRWLLDHVANALDAEYQGQYRRYWGFFRGRAANANFRDAYFQQLAQGLANPPELADLVELLYIYKDAGQTLQFSFCSKLCHMLDPHRPIYDAHIREFYWFSPPDGVNQNQAIRQRKINGYMDFYNFLIKEYQRVIDNNLMGGCLNSFHDHFQEAQDVTDQRIIDFVIWGFVGLVQQGWAAH